MTLPNETVTPGTYSITEVATRLGVSRSHVQDLLAEGAIPFVQLGARRVIPRQAVEDMLQTPASA
ncbi:MAG: helix-turn-helix domain-containing protein [Dehalococcoidia bacterium]